MQTAVAVTRYGRGQIAQGPTFAATDSLLSTARCRYLERAYLRPSSIGVATKVVTLSSRTIHLQAVVSAARFKSFGGHQHPQHHRHQHVVRQTV